MQRRERSYNTHNMHNHNNKNIMSARRKESKRQQKAIVPAAPPASEIWHSQRNPVADRCTAYIVLRLDRRVPTAPPSHFVREFRRLAVLVGTFPREAQAQGHKARKLARKSFLFRYPVCNPIARPKLGKLDLVSPVQQTRQATSGAPNRAALRACSPAAIQPAPRPAAGRASQKPATRNRNACGKAALTSARAVRLSHGQQAGLKPKGGGGAREPRQRKWHVVPPPASSHAARYPAAWGGAPGALLPPPRPSPQRGAFAQPVACVQIFQQVEAVRLQI
jgi:hypothetical protein